MATKQKIRIEDDAEGRRRIDTLFEGLPQNVVAEWSLHVAEHILAVSGIHFEEIDAIRDGFTVNRLWQAGQARMHDVRQAGFHIHRIARETSSEIEKNALRATGQAVASGHMREHAMVATDYAVKTVGLITGNDPIAISAERSWQLDELKKVASGNR